MAIVSYAQPFAAADGIIRHPDVSRAISTWLNPHAGQIAGPTVTAPNAQTPLEQTIMDIHVLTGPKHSEAGQTPGNFLKATGPATFGFQPHGLTAPDVGALPVAGTAADSDKLDGQHANEFLGATAQAVDSDKLDGSHAAAFEAAISAPGDAAKIWDGTKTFRYNDRLCASDGSPNPALSANAAGAITAVNDLTFGTSPGRLSYLSSVTGNYIAPADAMFSLYNPTGTPRHRLRVWYAGTATIDIWAPNATNGIAAITTGGTGSMLTLSPASGFVGINNNAPAVALDVTGAAKISLTLTLPSMSSAGFVKNSAAGLLSGGNALAAGDLPADIGHPTSDTYPIPRFRGIATAHPTTDLRNGDLYLNNLDAATCGLYIRTSGAWRKYNELIV